LESNLATIRAELRDLAQESSLKVKEFESIQQDLASARSDHESVQTRFIAREDMIKDLEYINLELKDTVAVRDILPNFLRNYSQTMKWSREND
jgi:hypothetical protein